jgi:hypothetical protein
VAIYPYIILIPLPRGLKKDTKQPDLFEGLQIHSQLKGGKMKKTRKNRKPRK